MLMSRRLLPLLAIVIACAAHAQAPSAPPPPAEAVAPGPARVALVNRPSLAPVGQALSASGLEDVNVVLVVEYDASGAIVDVVLDRTSGNEALDRAILDWGRQAKLTPGAAGKGRIPFSLVNDADSDDPDAYARFVEGIPELDMQRVLAPKPSTEPLTRAMAASTRKSTDAEILLAHDAAGNITNVTFLKRSGAAGIDDAILAWAKQLKLAPGEAGMARLPLEFLSR